eukprot:5967627-Alexandrium_andersonii.AAC.1
MERDYLNEHALVWHQTRENEADIEGRPRPFSMVWDADLQLTRRICEADMYIPASSHESDHI